MGGPHPLGTMPLFRPQKLEVEPEVGGIPPQPDASATMDDKGDPHTLGTIIPLFRSHRAASAAAIVVPAGGGLTPPSIFPATVYDLRSLQTSDLDELEAFYGRSFSGDSRTARMMEFSQFIG